MALSPVETTVRCVEIAKGLTALPPSESIFSEAALSLTKDTGVLARGAALLRGQQTIDAGMLTHVATQMGSSWTELTRTYLPSMVDMGWGELRLEGSRITGFREHIPPVDEVLRTLGANWDSARPSDHDTASVKGLHMLSDRPLAREAFASEMGVADAVAKDVIDYGVAGTYFDESGQVLWSPLFFSANEGDVSSFLGRTSEAEFSALGQISKALKGKPGLPVDRLPSGGPLLDSAVRGGFFSAVKVRSRTKEHSYFFPPHAQFSGKHGSDLFDKARAVVAALRHGQYHAEVTAIRYPLALLQAFVEGRMKPHSYAVYQYATLKVMGIADIRPAEGYSPIRYRVEFIDTPENRQVVKLAELLLRAGEAANEISDPEIVLMFGQGIVSNTAQERVARRQRRVAANDSMERLIRSVKGVRY